MPIGAWMPPRADDGEEHPVSSRGAPGPTTHPRRRRRRRHCLCVPGPRSPALLPWRLRPQRWRRRCCCCCSPAWLLLLLAAAAAAAALLLSDRPRVFAAAAAPGAEPRNSPDQSMEPVEPSWPASASGRNLSGDLSPSPPPPQCPAARAPEPPPPSWDGHVAVAAAEEEEEEEEAEALSGACARRRLLQGPLAAFPAPLPPGPARAAAAAAWASSSGLGEALARHFGGFRLPFCAAYSAWDLLRGMGRPESLDCSLRHLLGDALASAGPPLGEEGEACRACLDAYLRLDHHAREKYEDFELLLDKFLPARDFSVRSCLQACKEAYKAWLCAEYFNVTQLQCEHRVPCKRYCLEVQTRCPFVLPDNDELIYGGLPGFICTGLLEEALPEQQEEEARCCDLAWDYSCHPHLTEESSHNGSVESQPFHPGLHQGSHSNPHHSHPHHHHHHHQHYNLYYHHPQDPQRYHPPHPSVLPVSAGGSRLGHGKIRLCVLVLMLLHTMASFSGLQGGGSATGGALGLEVLPHTTATMEESLAARDE